MPNPMAVREAKSERQSELSEGRPLTVNRTPQAQQVALNALRINSPNLSQKGGPEGTFDCLDPDRGK